MTSSIRTRGGAWLRGWDALLHLALDVLLAPLHLFAWVLAVAGFFSLVGGVGLLLLLPGLLLAWLLARLDRSRMRALLGVDLEEPVRPPVPWWRTWWLEAWPWKSVAWSFAGSLWGVVSAAVVATLLVQGLVLAAWPLYAAAEEASAMRLLGITLSSTPAQVFGWLVGVLLVLATPLLALALAAVSATLARWLIGRPAEEQVAELSARVETLDRSRAATVDSVEAERRRIERDLHDGPQQRLVALAMDLGLARDLMERDPAAARELLDSAHAASKEAITEMRHVARGITPPILTDRGLDAALSALAARSPVPVAVDVRLGEGVRPDPAVEAIAYFVVSEALTNVAKHAAATRAQVTVDGTPGTSLAITVTDDGVGGADPHRGTGLVGLTHRVAAVDGRLDVTSPEGGPTTLHATLPWRSRHA